MSLNCVLTDCHVQQHFSVLTNFHPKQREIPKMLTQSSQHPKASKPNILLQIASHVGLQEAQKGSNFVFSPASIQTVLGMVAAGSIGSTLEQILSSLNADGIEGLNSSCSKLFQLLSDHSNGGLRLFFLNGIWVHQTTPLKSSYEEVVIRVYKAEARAVDIVTKADEVREEVNSRAENSTNGLIKSLLPPGSPEEKTKLVLANALCFKGAWYTTFNPCATQERDFYLLDGRTVRVPFMTTKASYFLGSFNFQGSSDGFEVLKLPYEGQNNESRFSTYIFLPHQRNGLQNLMQRFSSDAGFSDRYLCLREFGLREFWLPKFKVSFDFEASTVMAGLGLISPFLALGELEDMVDAPEGKKLVVSGVFHGASVEVNEGGTEAAAATGVVIIQRSYKPPGEFVADHPFMFMIREGVCGVVFFIGTVIDPSQNASS